MDLVIHLVIQLSVPKISYRWPQKVTWNSATMEIFHVLDQPPSPSPHHQMRYPCRYITMYIGYCLGLLCNMSYRIRREAILRDIGCGPKWIICITRCSFQGDSKSGGLKLAPFLIRQKNAKYLQKAAGRKFELLHFG